MNDQSFFSVDRLVEFGLSMAVAQQMVNMMNQTMRTMYIPGSIQSMPAPNPAAAPGMCPPPLPATCYVALEGKQVGPLSESELCSLITQGKVTKDSLCWFPGLTSWQPVENTPQVLRLVALAPPPMPNQ
ncbi:DUF4339 domain-containing protein [Pseudoprevotella muciniphila]|uniref:DUF4339 domain-containing protein n=1 Tax=Pseudoprevotella muciniphila TaxID=2133944 RepID=A0A5P8E5V4_9BACT|nr:DUF4339 domain-containing protein [Pseudoprevotella muciniphila]QFQ12419.1 DUF4339 domain-containing protein [Pseudoprevotella muciniphila]